MLVASTLLHGCHLLYASPFSFLRLLSADVRVSFCDDTVDERLRLVICSTMIPSGDMCVSFGRSLNLMELKRCGEEIIMIGALFKPGGGPEIARWCTGLATSFNVGHRWRRVSRECRGTERILEYPYPNYSNYPNYPILIEYICSIECWAPAFHQTMQPQPSTRAALSRYAQPVLLF